MEENCKINILLIEKRRSITFEKGQVIDCFKLVLWSEEITLIKIFHEMEIKSWELIEEYCREKELKINYIIN